MASCSGAARGSEGPALPPAKKKRKKKRKRKKRYKEGVTMERGLHVVQQFMF